MLDYEMTQLNRSGQGKETNSDFGVNFSDLKHNDCKLIIIIKLN